MMRQKTRRQHEGCKSNRDGKENDVLRLERTKNGMEIRAEYLMAEQSKKKY
jgi:hypothetical protein